MKAFVPVLSLPKMPLCPLNTPPPPSVKIPFIFQGLVQRPPFPRKPFFFFLTQFFLFASSTTHPVTNMVFFSSESPVLKPSFYICELVSSPGDNEMQQARVYSPLYPLWQPARGLVFKRPSIKFVK